MLRLPVGSERSGIKIEDRICLSKACSGCLKETCDFSSIVDTRWNNITNAGN